MIRHIACVLAVGLISAGHQGPAAAELQGDWKLIPAVVIAGESPPTLQERLRRYGVPGVSLAVIQDGRVGQVEVFGFAQAQGEQLTPDTLLQAASISKPVTALGVLALIEHGRVSLHHPINAYLGDWTLRAIDGESASSVTVAEILSHTGGVNVPSYPGFEPDAELPGLTEILDGGEAAFSDPIAQTEPAGAYRYSGGGYMVLQRMIEAVSGQDFECFMQRQLFDPAGMETATFRMPPKTSEVAHGHGWTGEPLAYPWLVYPQAAAAGLWATPEDLAQALVAYGAAFSGHESAIWSQVTARQVAELRTGDMGLGFGVHGAGDALAMSHAGWTRGFRSQIHYHPHTGDGAVIMTNADGGHLLIGDILRTLAAEYNWPDPREPETASRTVWSAERLKQIAGNYRMQPAGFTLSLTVFGSDLEIHTPRGSRYRAVPVELDELIIVESGDRMRIDQQTGQLELWGMTGTLQSEPIH